MDKNKKWLKEYINLMYPTNTDNLDIEAAKSLKFQHIPNKFLKQNLINDTIWMNKANEYNDPYDCALKLLVLDSPNVKNIRINTIESFKKNRGLKFTNKEITYLMNCKLDEFYKFIIQKDPEARKNNFDPNIIINSISLETDLFIKRFSDKIQSSILNCSFSEVNDSILMWSHYANNHRGFCLEYDFKKLGEKSEFTRMLQPVIYKKNIFDCTKYLRNKDKFNNLFTSYLAMIKSIEWKYEKEWRYALILDPDFKSFNKGVPTPTAIFLGAEINQRNENCIKKIAEHKSIPVYKMIMNRNEFKLTPKRIL